MPKMNRLDLLKADRLITLLYWIGWPAIATYFLCMVVIPVIQSGFEWNAVQGIWDRWQSLNVGMLALIASVIAFQITRYKENRQSARDFRAARAFLPDTLSKLTSYLSASAAVHMKGWNNLPQGALPAPPDEYREVFANCIRHADDAAGEQLSETLMWLQVRAARLERFYHHPAHTIPLRQLDALRGLRLDGQLYASVHRLFDYARGITGLDSRPLTWEDYSAAYVNLGLQIEHLAVEKVSLERLTKSHIARDDEADPGHT